MKTIFICFTLFVGLNVANAVPADNQPSKEFIDPEQITRILSSFGQIRNYFVAHQLAYGKTGMVTSVGIKFLGKKDGLCQYYYSARLDYSKGSEGPAFTGLMGIEELKPTFGNCLFLSVALGAEGPG